MKVHHSQVGVCIGGNPNSYGFLDSDDRRGMRASLLHALKLGETWSMTRPDMPSIALTGPLVVTYWHTDNNTLCRVGRDEVDWSGFEREDVPPRSGVVTVGELVAALQRLPQDALAYTEGCDCTGPCRGVELRERGRDGEDSAHVMLLREDGNETARDFADG
jgi:hypothetical protein